MLVKPKLFKITEENKAKAYCAKNNAYMCKVFDHQYSISDFEVIKKKIFQGYYCWHSTPFKAIKDDRISCGSHHSQTLNFCTEAA